MASIFRVLYLSDSRIRKFAQGYVDRLAPYIKFLVLGLPEKAIKLDKWSRLLEKLDPAFIMLDGVYAQWKAPPAVTLAYQRDLAALYKAVGIHCKEAIVFSSLQAANLPINPERPSTFSDRGLLRLISEQVTVSCISLALWPFCFQLELGCLGYANLVFLTLEHCHLYSDRGLTDKLQAPSKIQTLEIRNPKFGSGCPLKDLLCYVASSLIEFKLELVLEGCPGMPLQGLHFPKLKHLAYKRDREHADLGIPIAPNLVSLEIDTSLSYPFQERDIDEMRYFVGLYLQCTSLKRLGIRVREGWWSGDEGVIHFDGLEDFGDRRLEIVVTKCMMKSYRYISSELLARTKSLWINGRDGHEVWAGTEMMACPILEEIVIIGHDAESLLSKLAAPRLTKTSIYEDEQSMFAVPKVKARGKTRR